MPVLPALLWKCFVQAAIAIFVVQFFNNGSSAKREPCGSDWRPGDIAQCYADPALAEQLLGWRAERDLARMCADSWRWQQQNPDGY